MIACVILWMTSSRGVRPPTKSIIPAIPHILMRLLAYSLLAKHRIFFQRLQLGACETLGEQMRPRGHVRFMRDLSYKVVQVSQVPCTLYPTSDRHTLQFRPNRPRLAKAERQRSPASTPGFLRVNRMQAATKTSKSTIESPSGLDFVREIEMWCSLCLVFGTVNVIHRIIDFAETKSVR